MIAVVKDGHAVHIGLAARRLDLSGSEAEIEARRETYVAPELRGKRGYRKFCSKLVASASEGVAMPRF